MKAIGDEGEKRAQNFIQSKYGWQLLNRNWRTDRGELDIIYLSKADSAIHFIEVKQRRASIEQALESMTERKAQRWRLAARAWLAQSDYSGYPCQFDVVVISGEHIELRENVLT